MTAKKSRHIQILRGLAILAVVLIHTIPGGMYTVVLRPFLNFAVGLFIFLSGMLSDAKKYNPKKRIIKVIVPYVIWTLIYVALNNLDNPAQIPFEFIKHLITARSAAMMYYIPVYCELTLLIPLIDKLAKSKFKYFGFLITPAEIIVMRLLPMITGYEVNEYIRLIMGISCLGWFSYFYLGYLLGNNLITVRTSTKKLVVLLIISIPVQILEGYWRLTMGSTNIGTQLKLSAVLTGSLFVLLAYRFICSEKEYNFKALKFLGDNSFGIYFSHSAIKILMNMIPQFSQFVIFPFNSLVIILVDLILIIAVRKILGKFSKYLAF